MEITTGDIYNMAAGEETFQATQINTWKCM